VPIASVVLVVKLEGDNHKGAPSLAGGRKERALGDVWGVPSDLLTSPNQF
jgi:hypothetical protein